MKIVQGAEAARARRADAHLRQLRQARLSQRPVASRSDRSKPIPAARLKEPFRSAGLAVQFLRAACPADFPPSLPVYLLSSHDAPHYQPNTGDPTWWACMPVRFPDNLRDVLIGAGAWQGDGFCVLFHQQRFDDQRARFAFDRSGDPYRLMFQFGLATVIHEAGHYVVHAAGIREQTHGVAFVRAAAHIWHRVSDFAAFELRDVNLPVDAGCVYSTLAAELVEISSAARSGSHRRHDRIAHVLRTDPPPAFVRLFR